MFDDTVREPGFFALNVLVVSVMVGVVVNAWTRRPKYGWLAFLLCYFLMLEICGYMRLLY
jgi:hypothetical protein